MEVAGIMKWYISMSAAVGVRESQVAFTWEHPAGKSDPQFNNPGREAEESANWGLEDYTECYGQEKKLWVNISIRLYLSVSIYLSHPPQNIWLQEK